MKSVLVLAFTFAIGAMILGSTFEPRNPVNVDLAGVGTSSVMGDPILFPPPPPPPPSGLQVA